ncbi:predicted protein [Nematostella vectensis]|uniref:Reverse transcriptase domain-containing protein n=1 Tax=Nematostella vectensis TaxID=45351 RepID=A7S744_NEMVE|nr:predicted protein [Nematostella vectensis]|eukprot:XP_001632495.1 predicted protein [Nematostella vectensis]
MLGALFACHCNPRRASIDGKIRLFADDCVLNLHLTSDEFPSHLHQDLNKLAAWSKTWKMDFNP